ncbi:O-acetylhomoserine aminocarboxypropyltransferase/cysteine synthase [Muricaecibacterium torontonense]|uniref:O-acetylhomoserine aminocarboxypropyltransferase/cysteine synthase n=1 Tax=Muricaecibacterium torontonense TaxID=3032871 RepID=A0A4S2F5Q8_9ACTN|nr:O-acetylhomoserine aminocarboxypropyltransferase/cysteine synthase family protein [Muricaecibacterium torontonense]TGY63013.1 O-acetylhomoserine aminocarboxypropyltransferase/cysteine synthase [Muricaecibacterium torontonense]
MDVHTQCIHAGYHASNGQPRTLPIALSTTFPYDSCEEVAALFDLSENGFFYSRIGNPTCDVTEQKIAALEGGVGAMLTSSGQAANLIAVLNLAQAGDSIVASSAIYGGTVNLFSVTLKRFGIETVYVSPRATKEEILAAIQSNTKAVFGETVANPALDVLDIETFAAAAHEAGVPLIVDNTFPTPVLCRPFEWGADIVTHSTTKYIDGHAMTVGGVIVDSGKFNWAASGRFPEFCEPDESYHGVVYTRDFGDAAYIVKARVQLMRDLGCYPPATNAFILNETLETLPLRMAQHGANALAVAQWLQACPEVASVNYPGLPSSPDRDLAEKYLPNGCCGVISFVIKGGRDRAAAFLDALKLARIEVHVADSQTCVLHPASSTHRQLTDEQLAAAGVEPGLVRLSCGLESADDIIADLAQALDSLA